MTQKLLSILTVAILLTACSNNESNSTSNNILTETNTELQLPLDSKINAITRTTRYFKNKGVEHLAISNRNGIYIFNLETKKAIKNIQFSKDGPNSIGRMSGFDIVNLDTIYVTSINRYNMIFLMDTSAQIKNKIKLDQLDRRGVSFRTPYLDNRFNDEFYSNGPVVKFCNMLISNAQNIHEFKIGYSLNFNTNKNRLLDLKYPILENNPKNEELEYSCIIQNQTIVLSFIKEHRIYVSNNNNDFVSYNCKSKYFKEESKTKRATDILGSVRNAVESSSYQSILYDSYRDVYYRFVYPGVQVTKKDNVMELNEFKKNFSIIVLDKNFNVLGETLLPDNTYNPDSYFINNEGLWLSTNHIHNPSFDPNFLKFKLLTL